MVNILTVLIKNKNSNQQLSDWVEGVFVLSTLTSNITSEIMCSSTFLVTPINRFRKIFLSLIRLAFIIYIYLVIKHITISIYSISKLILFNVNYPHTVIVTIVYSKFLYECFLLSEPTFGHKMFCPSFPVELMYYDRLCPWQ